MVFSAVGDLLSSPRKRTHFEDVERKTLRFEIYSIEFFSLQAFPTFPIFVIMPLVCIFKSTGSLFYSLVRRFYRHGRRRPRTTFISRSTKSLGTLPRRCHLLCGNSKCSHFRIRDVAWLGAACKSVVFTVVHAHEEKCLQM